MLNRRFAACLIVPGSASSAASPAFASQGDRCRQRRDRRLRPPRLCSLPPGDVGLAQPTNRRCAPTPSQAALDAARKSFGDDGRCLVADRDHPLRPGDRTEPAGAHPVLAGPQEHRPEAGAGSAGRQGPDRRRCGAARRKERRHAGARRAGVRALRHRLGGARGTGDAYRCAYGAAISGNLDDIAADARRRPGPRPTALRRSGPTRPPTTRSTATAPRR